VDDRCGTHKEAEGSKAETTVCIARVPTAALSSVLDATKDNVDTILISVTSQISFPAVTRDSGKGETRPPPLTCGSLQGVDDVERPDATITRGGGIKDSCDVAMTQMGTPVLFASLAKMGIV
jgi:hypothetical protein